MTEKTLKTMIITPELARQWLKEKNKVNRPITRDRVIQYAETMKDGRWKPLVTSLVVFDETGNLAQGQHRLSAVVESGVSIESYVVFDGCVEDKTLGGIAKGADGKDTLMLAAQARGIHITSASSLHAMARVWLTRGGSGVNPSHDLAARFALENLEHLERFLTLSLSSNGRAAVAGAFAHASSLGMKNLKDASGRLISLLWDDRGEEDPMYALHKALSACKGANSRQLSIQRYRLTVTALRVVHKGESRKLIRVSTKDDGSFSELALDDAR